MSIFSRIVGLAAFCVLLNGVIGDIDCSTENSCRNGDYECRQEIGVCGIDCSGEDACQDSTFSCKKSCHVDCTNQESCVDSTFKFESDTVSMNCKGQDACADVTIIANNDTVLMLTCDGEESCDDGIIELFNNATFSVECDGEDACNLLRCVCDGTNCETSGSLVCSNRDTYAIGNGKFKLADIVNSQRSKQSSNKHERKEHQHGHGDNKHNRLLKQHQHKKVSKPF